MTIKCGGWFYIASLLSIEYVIWSRKYETNKSYVKNHGENTMETAQKPGTHHSSHPEWLGYKDVHLPKNGPRTSHNCPSPHEFEKRVDLRTIYRTIIVFRIEMAI